jgi:hypothetical protein
MNREVAARIWRLASVRIHELRASSIPGAKDAVLGASPTPWTYVWLNNGHLIFGWPQSTALESTVDSLANYPPRPRLADLSRRSEDGPGPKPD